MKAFHNPEPFSRAGRPYAMAVTAGKFIFLAGQLGIRFEGSKRVVVEPGDAAAQIRQIFLNMREVLNGVGGTLDDICWMQLFVTNMADRLKMDSVRQEFFRTDHMPAATLIEVSGLALPGTVLEVNAIAVLD
jgi:2-iminobutanoate/2-iminopropanoate deaminase